MFAVWICACTTRAIIVPEGAGEGQLETGVTGHKLGRAAVRV